MKTFKDNAGRSWDVEVNVSTVKRVRSIAGVDLLDMLGGSLIERFMRDPVALGDALYAVCKPQADAKGIGDEAFGEALAGDAIEHATQALLEEIVSFCPSPRDRAALGRVLEKTNAAMDKARDLVEERISSGEVDRAIDEALAPLRQTPTTSSGAARASPASTPPT